MTFIIDLLIFAGSALMVWNIYRYVRYIRRVSRRGNWDNEMIQLRIPLVLLVGFLIGYVVVGVFGKPDLVMAGILFFGSVFVFLMVNMLEKVTTHIQETEQLEAKLMAAEESSRAKTVFLSNMSHEIRTPMNAIIGIDTIALREPGISDETREQLYKIDASARHLLMLINDILDMSRIESGQMIVRREPMVMDDMLDQVSSIIRSQCDEKGLEFEYKLHGRDRSSGINSACCMGDEIKVKQVLINILGNAVKFTAAPGKISFFVEAENCCAGQCDGSGCHVRFVIKDTGIGMDEDFLPKLFETFSQEDASATNRYGGSGLGMAITKSLVDMMDGSIQVESRKGEGTTFTVELDFEPVTGEEQQQFAEAHATYSDVDLAGSRILFAEDVEINAEILGDLLEMEEMEYDWAENGQIAVDKFSEHEPGYYDAILMDMRMPVMDGVAATRNIRALDREDAKSIPIIALTANAFYNDVRQCLDAGMDAHISKPVDTDVLMNTLRNLIGAMHRNDDSGEK